MKLTQSNHPFFCSALSAGCLILMASCGSDNKGTLTTTTPTTTSAPPAANEGVANVNLACQLGGTPAQGSQQKQQVQLQRQVGCTKTPEQSQFTHKDGKVSDFDFEFDCKQKVVQVKSKGADSQTQMIPIQRDGTVTGKLEFVGQAQDDGNGSGACWVGYIVNLSGKATCQTDAAPQPSPSDPIKKDRLQLATQIAFKSTNDQEVQRAGISGMPTPVTDPTTSTHTGTGTDITPLPMTSTTPMPGASPTGTPSPNPSMSPSPIPSPMPTLSVTPIKICPVKNPCPIEGKIDASCPSTQTSTGPY